MTEDELLDLRRRVEELEGFQMMLVSSLFKVTYVAPAKPRETMLVFADGTSWDPGSGRGLYMYISGAWIKL